MKREACAGGGVQPLLSAGRRIVVDGRPICDVCGRAVEQVAPDHWQHAGRSARRRFAAADLRASASCAELLRQFPSLAPVSGAEWAEARRRLDRLEAQVKVEAPYAEIVAGLTEGLTPGLARLLDLPERRRELAPRFAWAIPAEPALQALARYAPLVECGAGSGYWAALLRARGVDVLAFDIRPPKKAWTEVSRADSVAAARRQGDRTLVLCWPPYDDDGASFAALRAYRGDVLIHIGERDEGATGTVRFHRELALNWTLAEEVALPNWPRIRDTLMVYRRNPKRRPLALRDRCFECNRFVATGSIGRCDACFALRPPALALRAGRHRIEYPREVVEAMPPALRKAFEMSPNRIR